MVRFLVYSHLWLALGAAAQTWWMGELVDAPGWRAPLLAFLGTMVFYAYMRFSRMNHPRLAPSSPLMWFRQRRRVMLTVAVICGLAALFIGYPFAPDLLRTLWPAGVVGLLYVIPFDLAGGRTIGLRRVPGMKAFLIAFVWAMIVAGLPVALHGRELFSDVAFFLLVLQFCYVLALDIAFDVRDLPHDIGSLRTLPQLFGMRAARAIAVLFLLPWPVYLVARFLASRAGPDHEGVTGAGLLLPLIGFLATMLLVARADPRRGERYYAFLLDGTFVVIPLLAWIGSYF